MKNLKDNLVNRVFVAVAMFSVFTVLYKILVFIKSARPE